MTLKRFFLIVIYVMLLKVLPSNAQDGMNIKCMIQLEEYHGEGAYMAVSLLDAKENYVRTLQVFGKERRWYEDLGYWFRFFSQTNMHLDGISGASITAGNRKVFSFSITKAELNSGKKIRFETAVEDLKYYDKDVQVDLSTSNMGVNIAGTGYIKQIKLFQL